METITIEKNIKFENVIDSIESLEVSSNLNYELSEDNSYAKGIINLKGNVNTLLGNKSFNEEVDVDIYAPFEKSIDRDNFKIEVKDYSYTINQNNLVVYLIVSLDGFNDVNLIAETPETENVVEAINNLNEINENNRNTENTEVIEENVVENDNETLMEEIKENKYNVLLKDNDVKEYVEKSWATDLFKLSDNYSLFMKIHLD